MHDIVVTRVAITCRRVLLVLLGVLLLAGCATTRDSDPAETGRYLFDVYDENYSWAYTLRGFYIDRDGGVWTYDHSDDKWIPTPSRSGRLSGVDLADKFEHSKKVVTLDPRVVSEKARLIPSASRGAISRFSQSRDSGRSAHVAYLFDADRGDYRVVVLAAEGDSVESNSSDASGELLRWLKEVREKISETQR